jgi:hypothetical protein
MAWANPRLSGASAETSGGLVDGNPAPGLPIQSGAKFILPQQNLDAPRTFAHVSCPSCQ